LLVFIFTKLTCHETYLSQNLPVTKLTCHETHETQKHCEKKNKYDIRFNIEWPKVIIFKN
jgi:hypothetical protein